MKLYQSITIINHFFFITSHRNRGAAFGILQNEWSFFIVITLVVAFGLIYYIWKLRKSAKFYVLALSFILGGAIGNLIDRIRYAEVTDFLDFRFGSYQYPVFNVADSAIVIGVATILFFSVFYPQIIVEKDN